MKKLLILTAIVLGIVAWPTQAQDYTLPRGVPGIIFGYPADVQLIDDQAEVATVVWPNLSEIAYMGEYTLVAIDGVPIPERVRNSPFRRHEAACFAVDLLPGRHTLGFSYSEYLPAGFGRRTYRVVSPDRVDVVVDLEAGGVYQLRALLSQGAFAEFAVDDELTDPSIVDRLAQSRIVNRLAYTPLAGQPAVAQSPQSTAGRRTVQPAAPRTVQPAAPRGTQSAASRRTVQPASPRGAVQPAAPGLTVEPASSRRTVQPAMPRRTVQPVVTTAPVAPQEAAQLPEGTALLHIYRVRQMAGAAIGYDVWLGDEVLYRARNNSGVTIPVTGAGAAALWAKTESRVDLPLDIEPGREYWIRCGMRMGAFVGRPVLEIVDAATGRAEFEQIPHDRLSAPPPTPVSIGVTTASPPPAAISAPIEPSVSPEPVVAPVQLVVPEPEPEPEPEPVPIPAAPPAPVRVVPETGIGNGTLEVLLNALPDSVMFRPVTGVEIPEGTLIVKFVSGSTTIATGYNASGTFKLSPNPTSGSLMFTFTDRTTFTAKNFDFPAGFKPDRITFSVSGRDMTFDLARSAWLDASGRPIPSSVPASAIKPAPTPPTPAAPEYRSITLDELAEWEKTGSGESGKFMATAYYTPITDAGILEMLNASDDYFFTGKIGANWERVPMVQFKSKTRLPEMKHSQKVTLWFTAASKGEEKEAKQYRIIERIEITE